MSLQQATGSDNPDSEEEEEDKELDREEKEKIVKADSTVSDPDPPAPSKPDPVAPSEPSELSPTTVSKSEEESKAECGSVANGDGETQPKDPKLDPAANEPMEEEKEELTQVYTPVPVALFFVWTFTIRRLREKIIEFVN